MRCRVAFLWYSMMGWYCFEFILYFCGGMKYINTALLLLVVIGLGVNFYMDYQRDAALNLKVITLTAPPVVKEVSPFDNLPKDPEKDHQKAPSGPITTISYEKTEYNFGNIDAGRKYTTTFKFTNTGTEDLLISEAIGSCGCTVPSWPEEPIKAGKSGVIKVEFDTKGRYGEQLKTVTVTTNTEPNKNVLTIKSNVKVKVK